MLRTLLYICVLLALVIAPVAHASQAACESADYAADESSKEKQQDDEQLAQAMHICCGHAQVALPSPATPVSLVSQPSAPIVAREMALVSVTLAPLVEPPLYD